MSAEVNEHDREEKALLAIIEMLVDAPDQVKLESTVTKETDTSQKIGRCATEQQKVSIPE